MKIEFTKLVTSEENIKVDFGDGNGFREYPVNDAKKNGITIPNNITEFNNIKIKGSANVIPNLEVMKSLKFGPQNYEIHIKDYYPFIEWYHYQGLCFNNLTYPDILSNTSDYGNFLKMLLYIIQAQLNSIYYNNDHNNNLLQINNSNLYSDYNYTTPFYIKYIDSKDNNTLLIPFCCPSYGSSFHLIGPDFFYKSTDEIQNEDSSIVIDENIGDYIRNITSYDTYYLDLISQLKQGMTIYYKNPDDESLSDTNIKIVIDNDIEYSVSTPFGYNEDTSKYERTIIADNNTGLTHTVDDNFSAGTAYIVEC